MELNVILRLLFLICLFLPRLAIKLNQATELNSNTNSTNVCINETDVCFRIATQTKFCSIGIVSLVAECKDACDACGKNEKLPFKQSNDPIVDIFKDNKELIDDEMLKSFKAISYEYQKSVYLNLIQTSVFNINYEKTFQSTNNILNYGHDYELEALEYKEMELKNMTNYLEKAISDTEFKTPITDRLETKMLREFKENSITMGKLKDELIKNQIGFGFMSAVVAATAIAAAIVPPFLAVTSIVTPILIGTAVTLGTTQSLITTAMPPLTEAYVFAQMARIKIQQLKEDYILGFSEIEARFKKLELIISDLHSDLELMQIETKIGVNNVLRLYYSNFLLYSHRINEVVGEIKTSGFYKESYEYMKIHHSKVIVLRNAFADYQFANYNNFTKNQLKHACSEETRPMLILKKLANLYTTKNVNSLLKLTNGKIQLLKPLIRVMMTDIPFVNVMETICSRTADSHIQITCNREKLAKSLTSILLNTLNMALQEYYIRLKHEISSQIETLCRAILKNTPDNAEKASVVTGKILSQLEIDFPELKFLVFAQKTNTKTDYFSSKITGAFSVKIEFSDPYITALIVYWHRFEDAPRGYFWERCHNGNKSFDGSLWFTDKPQCTRQGLVLNKILKSCKNRCSIKFGEKVPSCDQENGRKRCFKERNIADSICEETTGCVHNSFRCRKQRIFSKARSTPNITMDGLICKNDPEPIGGFSADVCFYVQNGTHRKESETEFIESGHVTNSITEIITKEPFHSVRPDCSSGFSFPEPFNFLKKVKEENAKKLLSEPSKIYTKNWNSFNPNEMAAGLMKTHELFMLGWCIHGIITQMAFDSRETLTFATNMNGVSSTLEYKDSSSYIEGVNKLINQELNEINVLNNESIFYEKQINTYIRHTSSLEPERNEELLKDNLKLVETNFNELKNNIYLKIQAFETDILSMKHFDAEDFNPKYITKINNSLIKQIFIVMSCGNDTNKKKFPPGTDEDKNACINQLKKEKKVYLDYEKQKHRFENRVKEKKWKRKLKLAFIIVGSVMSISVVALIIIVMAYRRKKGKSTKLKKSLDEKIGRPKISTYSTSQKKFGSLARFRNERKSSDFSVKNQKKLGSLVLLRKESKTINSKIYGNKAHMSNEKKTSNLQIKLSKVPKSQKMLGGLAHMHNASRNRDLNKKSSSKTKGFVSKTILSEGALGKTASLHFSNKIIAISPAKLPKKSNTKLVKHSSRRKSVQAPVILCTSNQKIVKSSKQMSKLLGSSKK